MAGSYNHCVEDDGSLRSNEDFVKMIENLGDAYEAVEEMYGMIWYLANAILTSHTNAELVEEARKKYSVGVEISPTGRPALF